MSTRKIKINNIEIEFPSVTQILNIKDKPALINWAVNSMAEWIRQNSPIDDYGLYVLSEGALEKAKREYRNISKEALDIGTAVHDMILEYTKTGKKDFDFENEQIEKSFNSFLDWEESNKVEWLESEKMVINLVHGYNGRFDAIAKVNGKITLIDFKTSKGIYTEMKEQLGAYWFAYKEKKDNYVFDIMDRDDKEYTVEDLEPKYKIDSFGILRLDKVTGFPEWRRYDKQEIKRAGEGFLSLTKYYYQSKKRRLKNNMFVEKYWGAK